MQFSSSSSWLRHCMLINACSPYTCIHRPADGDGSGTPRKEGFTTRNVTRSFFQEHIECVFKRNIYSIAGYNIRSICCCLKSKNYHHTQIFFPLSQRFHGISSSQDKVLVYMQRGMHWNLQCKADPGFFDVISFLWKILLLFNIQDEKKSLRDHRQGQVTPKVTTTKISKMSRTRLRVLSRSSSVLKSETVPRECGMYRARAAFLGSAAVCIFKLVTD